MKLKTENLLLLGGLAVVGFIVMKMLPQSNAPRTTQTGFKGIPFPK